MDILPQVFILLPILIFSVILHEVSHGLIAHRFGDDTALDSGRLTLNPIPHVDPLGSVIFPLACLILCTALLRGEDFRELKLKQPLLALTLVTAGITLSLGLMGYIISAAARWGSL